MARRNGMDVDHEKDREQILPIVLGEAEIIYRRTSVHPVTYALILRVRHADQWIAV